MEKAKARHRFSYLRGIDGKLPGEQNGSDKEKKKNDTNNKEERDIKKLEEPVGKSQYDYLRRLAERIERLDEQLKYEHNGSIKAIGVLGNDFYDKFLVLQALGQKFPDRIFFTTDLDANYFHPANLEWTRNLVVASTYGLQLQDDLQKEVPPFRNAYQTSIFAATLRAFDFLHEDDFNLKPRIFEIARFTAVDLTEKTEKPGPINQVLAKRRFPSKGWISFAGILVVISFLGMLLWLYCTTEKGIKDEVNKFFTEQKNILLVWLIILVTVLVILIGVHKIITLNPWEEPFSWSEGISIWPTEMIRVIALILSLAFLSLSKRWLKGNNKTIHDEFALKDNNEKKSNGELNNTAVSKALDVNTKWKEYLSGSTLGKRRQWIISVSAVYYLLCIIIFIIFGFPNNPVRSSFSTYFNLILLLVLVIPVFLYLTFFILDTIMLCRKFITQFSEKQPQWNIESLEKFAKKLTKKPEPPPEEPGPSPKESDSPSKDTEHREKDTAVAALSEWMLVQLIARRTDVVGKLFFFPFIVWSLIIISRLHYFDNWHTPLGLIIIISLSAVLAWVYAVNLRRSAEKLRRSVIKRLDQQLVGIYADDPENKADATFIQHVLKEVKDLKTGAFASYVQQSALQSLLVPIGGISGLKILELLSNLG
jgi:hypothetical protein